MGNEVLIKTGKTVPPNGTLKYKELGYSEENDGLYIGTSSVDGAGKNIPKQLNKSASMESIFNILYPIGSVYFTENDKFNPNETEGWTGTWENVSGCYLYLGEEQDNIGGVDGDKTNPLGLEDHYLTESQLASHTHSLGNLSVDSEDLGTAKGSVSGSLSGSASHTHTISGTAGYAGAHTHDGYRKAISEGTAGGTAYAAALAGTTNAQVFNSISARSAGSHTHSISGTADSSTINGSDFSFRGSTSVHIGSHSHSISGGSIDNTGNGAPIEHISNFNPPRFTCIAWKRIA